MPPAKKSKAKSLTKAQLAAEIADKTGLTKVQVKEVLEALTTVVGEELKAGNPIGIQGLVKITVVHKKATPARPGRNPRTNEAITIGEKPARKIVKVRALKGLKELAPK